MDDRITFRDIKSWTPAIDPRSVGDGDTYVLDGQNFVFDSKGPKSYFASRLLNGGDSIVDETDQAGDVQSLGGFIFTPTSIGRFDSVGTFTVDYTFSSPISGTGLLRRWTRAYVAGVPYFCHPSKGILKYENSTWSEVDLGISNPEIICAANSRLQILSPTTHYWSTAGDPEDLTPALGGAGLQLIASHISGTPIAMVGLPQAIIVWTTEGGIIAEYVGGDIVYRHYPLEHQYIPVSDTAITRLFDGSYLICTRQGLYRQSIQGTPDNLTPLFNEWFREKYARIPLGSKQIRLDYYPGEDQVYFQIRDWSIGYTETYVLSLSLDKWGKFTPSHRGIISHSIHTEPVNMPIGYVDTDGIPHRFLPFGSDRETEPNVYAGLDSWIMLGPFRSFDQRRPAFISTVDNTLEIQAIAIGSRTRPARDTVTVEDDQSAPEQVIDENAAPAEVIEEASIHLEYPDVEFSLLVYSDSSGADFPDVSDPLGDYESCLTTVPHLIRDTPNIRQYSLLAPGIWHRIKVSASGTGEYFHVTFGEITVNYAGQQNT